MTPDTTILDTETWHIRCDATALPKRGAMAIGAVLVSPTGVRHTLSQAVSGRGCSNEAEALALIAALQEAERLGARSVDVRCDNAVLVEQTVGDERTRIARLADVFARARACLARFDRAELRWISRRYNSEADTLARAALGLLPKPPKRKKR